MDATTLLVCFGLITLIVGGVLFSRRHIPRTGPIAPHRAITTQPSSSQFSAQDILNSSIHNIAGNHTEIEVKNIYPTWATPQLNAIHRVTLPMRRYFVGREDLMTKLEDRLRRTDEAHVTSLTGIAGVGKSALALEAAYRFSDSFPDGRYWIDLRSNDATQALRDLLSAMGVVNVEQLRDDAFALAEMARGQLSGRQVLLILDNAEGIVRRHRQQLLAMCLPAPAKTIITSRIMIDTDDIRVDVLSDDDALELLAAKGIEVASQRNDALKLVRRLGNLALAIEIVARRMCITRPTQSCADSLREIEESISLVDALRLPLSNVPDDSVAAAFALSYDLLDERLRIAFHALGLCAPSGAPVQGIAHMCNITESDARDSLRALAMLSLVEFDGKRAQLHPLLRDYARARAYANPTERNDLIVRHVAYFGGEIGSRYQQALNDEQDSLPALMTVDAESANVQLAQERALLPSFPMPELAVEITDYLALYWRQRHINPHQLLNWLTQACKLAEQTQQQNNQANLLQAIGEVQAFCDQRDEALRAYKRALELFTAVGDRLGQANALRGIGDVQAFRKENDAALDSYDQALRLFIAVGDRLGQANALKAIGDVQAFQDQHDEALGSYERALELFTAVGDRLGQANVLQVIGDVYTIRDHRDEALQSYNQALQLFTAVGDRLGQANALKAIGDVQAFRKENDAALHSYDQALELFSAAQSKLGQANILKAIGDMQAFQDQHDEALGLYERALELSTAAESKLGQANVLKAIGDIHAFRKDNDLALEWHKRALELFTAIGDRLGQANVLKAIGDVRAFLEEGDAALQSYEQALQLYIVAESKLGQAHTLQAIGDLHALHSQHDRALKLYEQALTLFTQVRSVLGQANVYVSLGQLSGKESCFDKAISLYASINDAYSLARGKFYYALSLWDQDSETARELLADARVIWTKINFEEGVEAIDDLLNQMVSG